MADANSGPFQFGVQLRRLRVAAGLTQEALAERSGLSVDAISTLESGRRLRPHPSTVGMLADALGVGLKEGEEFAAAARLLRLTARRPISSSDLTYLPTDALPDRAPLPAGSRMPLAPNPLFIGRGEELLQVAAALRGSETTVALGQVVASTGLGGLGKTQLAVEFVHRFGRNFEGGVFWLSFASADEVPLQVASCAGSGAMDLAPGIEGRPLEERVQRVQRAWQSAVPRLLVFDNCEEEALLEAWRPTSGGCRVLVTSRRSHWSPTLGVTALPLDVLPRVDSIELLRRYRPDLAVDDSSLDAIAAELGDLPLALHLAGSYLRAYRAEVNLNDYLAELQRSDVVRHASLLGAGLDDSVSPTHHRQGIAQTFALCLGCLDREGEVDRVALALLARMACMAPGEPVPRELLAKTLEEVDPLRRADGLRRLGAVGLVQQGEGWLRLHRLLVQFVSQAALDPMAQPAVDGALIAWSGDAGRGFVTNSAAVAVIPHLLHVAGTGTGDASRRATLADVAGRTLKQTGALRAARPWLELALTIREKALDRDDDAVANSLNILAELLTVLAEWVEARRLFDRARSIREQKLGLDHPDTAASLNDLGVLLRADGQTTAARSLFERALTIREQALGQEHLETAESLNNLAVALQDVGQLAAARRLFTSALDIRCRLAGPDHPATATSLNNLATVLREQGDLTIARTLFERARAIWERVAGPDHPYMAATLANLARLHSDQGDPAAALPLFERALAIRERALGPDHPDTVATRRALAGLAGKEDDSTATPLPACASRRTPVRPVWR